MALQFRPPVAPKPAPRTGSVSIVEDSDDLYDDIIHARQFTQKFPPPVAAKPKQLVPSVTEQKNTPPHNDIATKPSQKAPTPVTTRSKQNIAPVTKQRMSSSSNDMVCTQEDAIKCLQKVPPPVSPKPKQNVSPLTEQGDGPLYDNVTSTATKPKAPPRVLARRLTTQNTGSPVTEQCNLIRGQVQSTASPTQVSADFNTEEEEDIPLYDDTTSVIQDIPTPTQKFFPQFTSPFTVHKDVHAPIASSVTLPRAQRPSHQGITSLKKNTNKVMPGSCKMAALMSLTFPRLVQICSGCCGRKIYPMDSLSKGEELLIFFTKRATVIPAYRPGKNTEIYHIPMCSTFQFGLINDQHNGAEVANYNFDNITDILSQTRELPKVIKVLKSCVGKTEESSVSGGTLIFPKRVITHTDKKGKEKMELVCANSSNDKTLILKLPCIGNFSTHPSDVKMSILEYISYINVFPVTLQVFNYNKILSGESHIDPGTEFVLNNPTEVISYICSKDIFGEKNYPLLEVPVEAPVTVLCKVEHDGVNMMSVHDVAKGWYGNFSLSKIKNYVPFCEESSYETQNELYKEITLNISDTKEYYELTSPVDEPEHEYEYVDIQAEHKTTSPILSPHKFPKKSCLPPPCNTLPKQTSQDHPLNTIQPQKKNLSMPRQPQLTEERNKTYLQSLSRRDVLQLLDKMNLSQHKGSFQEEQVDGTILAALSGDDLKELGVTKGVQIKRLLRLINGTTSAKDVLENEHRNEDQIYY